MEEVGKKNKQKFIIVTETGISNFTDKNKGKKTKNGC